MSSTITLLTPMLEFMQDEGFFDTTELEHEDWEDYYDDYFNFNDRPYNTLFDEGYIKDTIGQLLVEKINP